MPDLRISQIAELTCLSKRYWQRMVMDGKVPGAAFIQMGERRTYIVDADKFLPWWKQQRYAFLKIEQLHAAIKKPADIVQMADFRK